MIDISVFTRIGGIERSSVPCMPEHIFENQEIIASVHFRNSCNNRQKHPEGKQRTLIAKERTGKKRLTNLYKLWHKLPNVIF